MATHLSLAAEPQFFRGASVQSRLLGFGLRHSVRPLLGLWAHLPFDLFPPNVIDHIARLLPVHAGTTWRTIDLSDCKSEWLQAKGVDDLTHGNAGAILYFHGGAFLTCGLNTHRRLVSRISYAAEQPVLNVGYRQMPYEPITESVGDGVDGFRWLLEQGYKAENITIAGDSAGGYLAFSVARAVMDKGWGRPGRRRRHLTAARLRLRRQEESPQRQPLPDVPAERRRQAQRGDTAHGHPSRHRRHTARAPSTCHWATCRPR